MDDVNKLLEIAQKGYDGAVIADDSLDDIDEESSKYDIDPEFLETLKNELDK